LDRCAKRDRSGFGSPCLLYQSKNSEIVTVCDHKFKTGLKERSTRLPWVKWRARTDSTLYTAARRCIYLLESNICWKVVFEKLFFKFLCVYLSLEKLVNKKYFLVNKKHFPVKEKFNLVSRKVFSFYFGRKTFSGSGEKFRNIILFADYIKFGSQTFNCYIYIYIYILFWIFIFQFHPLEFNFYINFGFHFYNYYLLFSYYFLIEIFYLSNLVMILLIITYFIWNNLWNVNYYYYFNFFIF
jgi:hypothetical protein